MTDRVNDWKERCQIMCDCQNDIIAFICKDKNCDNHTKQPLYCVGCREEVHWHKPLYYISDEISEYIKRWTKGRGDLQKLVAEATNRYSELKPLILYYENETLLVPAL